MLISLACVSSETHNLQRVFRPGAVVPYIGCIGMCRAKRCFFSRFGLNRPFWSERGYGFCPLVLNWVCFLEELATSSSFIDKTISLLIFTPMYVPCRNSLSCAPVTRGAPGLQV